MNLNDNELSPQQRAVVIIEGNIVVSASAGTGKTRTMIAKMVSDLSINECHKVIAAITFTIKAAQEIRDRLTIDSSQCFVGTNNSFALEEVIKPFMKDVYGDDFDIDMDTDYSNTDRKFELLSDGIENIKAYHTIYTYNNNKQNFVFDLALDIVKKSSACRLYLQAKYFAIYVDEYQDCDKDMHDFFMYLSDILKITTFVVGDDKQSIYRWRGANPNSFRSIFTKDNFTYKELTENHRSEKQIQDYSNLLFAETSKLVVEPQNSGNIIWVVATDENWVDLIKPLIDMGKTSALLRSQKDYSLRTGKHGASDGAVKLTEKSLAHIFVPQTPIDEITTNTAWLYTAIASFVLLDGIYSVYSLINDIPSKSDNVTVGKTKRLLGKITQMSKDTDSSAFSNAVKSLANILGYETDDNHIEKLFQTVKDSKYAVALNREKPKHCTLTLHSSKGLEFEQVILFAEDFAHNGNVGDDHINNHYVACTRAKKKLIIIDTDSRDAKAVKNKLKTLFSDVGLKSNQLVEFMS